MNTNLPVPRPFWSATAHLPTFPPLASNVTAEACVIGGGIAGLTTAYLLAREGVSVALVEAREIGEGETGHTTAHLAVPDDRYWYIEETYGAAAAKTVADSYAAAIDLVERIVTAEKIDCDFQRLEGYLISSAPAPAEALEKERAAAQRAGVQVALEAQAPAPSWFAGPALRFPDQAQFHPLKYLSGIARAISGPRVGIYLGTRALDIEESEDGVVVRSTGGTIRADHAVVATNTPFHERFRFHTKMAAYQTYAVAARVAAGVLPRVLMWDDGDPYHYVRLTPGDDETTDFLIVGGEDHKTGQEANPEARYTALGQFVREHFPMAGPIAFRWSGEIMEPLDGIAYLGRNPGSDCVYVITGDSGNGMTHATAGAMLVTDLIIGRPNPWLATYDPARKPVKETLKFLREQANNASQYARWIGAGDVDDIHQIAPGSGAIMRHGLHKLAVYRDQEGLARAYSAACPHLGCIVQWNRAEKTWDCPCHGSRFGPYGGVLHGPAVSALSAVDLPDTRPPASPRRSSESRKGVR